jgi:hypothetical protein
MKLAEGAVIRHAPKLRTRSCFAGDEDVPQLTAR